MIRETTEWEDIFAGDTSDKVLLFKIYEELIQLNIRRQTNKQFS